MKINLLYLAIPAAILACAYIVRDLQGRSTQTFFGSAETEPLVLHVEEDVMVKEVFIAAGRQVRKGDTLALLYRMELDRELADIASEQRRLSSDLVSSQELLRQERATIQAKAAAQIAVLEAEINEIKVRDSIDERVKSAVYAGLKMDRTASQTAISGLRKEIELVREVMEKELNELAAEERGSTRLFQTENQTAAQRIDLQNTERRRLVLIAPVDGYVDQVNIAAGAPIPAFRDMLRIYPLRPAKVIGFIHETADIPFRIGDSVGLVSGVRPDKLVRGQITAAGPKLVELPLRLRKFAEVRAWGREVIISLPPDNPYYIGERITISLQTAEQ